jgi:hypothetical protein
VYFSQLKHKEKTRLGRPGAGLSLVFVFSGFGGRMARNPEKTDRRQCAARARIDDEKDSLTPSADPLQARGCPDEIVKKYTEAFRPKDFFTDDKLRTYEECASSQARNPASGVAACGGGQVFREIAVDG